MDKIEALGAAVHQAAMKKERDDFERQRAGKTHFADDDTLAHIASSLKSQLLAAQVVIAKQREALLNYVDVVAAGNDPSSFTPMVLDVGGPAREALATQPDLSLLEAHDAAVKREGAREALEKSV